MIQQHERDDRQSTCLLRPMGKGCTIKRGIMLFVAHGAPGQSGQPGGPGEPGICPKYCAIDGGVFFEDGTRR
ncbi:hypothetical protein GCK32_016773 [Trichostrongylus colubriformis]|uniref:Uncharacterized protein n=1 Tax=Trichostrongylus colubriformis TaxID=6319 RepID=A0AAN8EPU5_TRICO